MEKLDLRNILHITFYYKNHGNPNENSKMC